MHPIDQTSTALVYSEAFRITSGALYHLVTTYLGSKVSDNAQKTKLILSHKVSFVFVASCKSEIADLEITTFVEKNIARLKISMHDVG